MWWNWKINPVDIYSSMQYLLFAYAIFYMLLYALYLICICYFVNGWIQI